MGRVPCCEKENVKRGEWTSEEDNKLCSYIAQHGTRNWRLIPKNAGLSRCGKSCRLRWSNYLRPDLKQEQFTEAEEQSILKLHSVVGNRWSLIAAQLRGRTDKDVKNYWNTKLKKKLSGMGIDPVTHKPFSHLMAEIATALAPGPQPQAAAAPFFFFKDDDEMLLLQRRRRRDAPTSRTTRCSKDKDKDNKIKLTKPPCNCNCNCFDGFGFRFDGLPLLWDHPTTTTTTTTLYSNDTSTGTTTTTGGTGTPSSQIGPFKLEEAIPHESKNGSTFFAASECVLWDDLPSDDLMMNPIQ